MTPEKIERIARITDFISYCNTHIKGDEKGEAQIFLDHFFTALGFDQGLKGAGASCEFRIKNEVKRKTHFADLVWENRVLLEMKKRGEDLTAHLQQVTSYWMELTPKPPFVILCNFDEFQIYDFQKKMYSPVDVIRTHNLLNQLDALAFLFPKPEIPVFDKSREDVTAKAAYYLAAVFKSLLNRKIDRNLALKYCLQCALCMFAQDIGMLPKNVFTRLLDELEEQVRRSGKLGGEILRDSYNYIGELFYEMNRQGKPTGGKYAEVAYFNGGMFDTILPIELTRQEIEALRKASKQDWKNVNPAIFGSVFEQSMERDLRHELGAHYTPELNIKQVVNPCLVKPWQEKIDAANNLTELYALLNEITSYTVLDPSCGSGNFLFVAYRELKFIEKQLLTRIRDLSTKPAEAKQLVNFLDTYPFVSTKQFYGYDINSLATELSKLTLMVAKEIAFFELAESLDSKEQALPLDNLDNNILCIDALLNDDGSPRNWGTFSVIMGNPPFQSKNKMQEEFGREYLNKLSLAYPEVSGMADYCVYWFRKAHESIPENHFAGLVATNTVRENYTRTASLDYILAHNGDIVEAVVTKEWTGEAAVNVSIIAWKKGEFTGQKYLYIEDVKTKKLIEIAVTHINSSLSLYTDVVGAKVLQVQKEPKQVFLGQTHGHEGFLLEKDEALKLLAKNPSYKNVLFPFLVGEEFIDNIGSQPKRFVIDFDGMEINEARKYKKLYEIVQQKVYPSREKRAKEQIDENITLLANNAKAKTNKHHINFFNYWWRLSYSREDMKKQIAKLKKYIVCSAVSQRNIFDFVCTDIHPNAALVVFTFEDDYSFGIIQSKIHWAWWKAKCSTLGNTYRYTMHSVWETFPFPQKPTLKQVQKIAKIAKELRDYRRQVLENNNETYRDLYRNLELGGKNPLKDLHEKLDKAVMEAYNFSEKQDLLQQILDLNLSIADKESKGEMVEGAGLPSFISNKEEFVTEDCVKFLF
jgi:type II restriction/modification system DNA methylase subunit YeeA